MLEGFWFSAKYLLRWWSSRWPLHVSLAVPWVIFPSVISFSKLEKRPIINSKVLSKHVSSKFRTNLCQGVIFPFFLLQLNVLLFQVSETVKPISEQTLFFIDYFLPHLTPFPESKHLKTSCSAVQFHVKVTLLLKMPVWFQRNLGLL